MLARTVWGVAVYAVLSQLYWHTTPPNYPALTSVPDNRIYLTADSVNAFLASYLRFTHGRVVGDTSAADGALIGKPDTTFRQVRIASPYGNTLVSVTDGHIPYPYGRELAGYTVADVDATVAKARTAGATVLVPAGKVGSITRAVLQWPGGYIAEIHNAT